VEHGTAKFDENMKALQQNWLFRGYFRNQEKDKKKAQQQ
jgi:phospholipid/cholesterol/gamma-HCH transport system substrate-binding protein